MKGRGLLSLGVSVVVLATMIMAPASATASEYGDGWEVPALLDASDSGIEGDPMIGIDSQGNAISVWMQSNGVWFNRYVNGRGWGNPLLISGTTSSGYPAVSIDLAVLDNGYAWLAFGLVGNIYATLYQPGFGWHPTALVENLAGTMIEPKIASDGEYTYVVWKRRISEMVPADAVFANVKMPDAYWDTTSCVKIDEFSGSTLYSLHSSQLDLAAGGIGAATVVWSQYNQSVGQYNVYANRFVSGSWQDQKLIDYNNDDDAISPRVAMDCHNNSVAVWAQKVEGLTNIYSNVFLSAKNRWYADTEAEGMDLLEQEDGPAGSPRVAMNSEGTAVAVWSQSQGSYNDVWSNRYVLGDGWGSENATIVDDLDTSAILADVTLDSTGNAVAVWVQLYWSKWDIVASVYKEDVGYWSAACLIEDQRTDSYANRVQVDLNDAGSAFAVWSCNDGDGYSVYSNRYVFPDDSPPELEVHSPEDGVEVTIPVVRVSGATEPGASLSVGGFLVAVDQGSGEFSLCLPLLEGENSIEVVAIDSAGNKNTVVVSVAYSNPVHTLEADILSMQTTIDDIYVELAEIWSAIDDVNGYISEANNDLLEAIAGVNDNLNDVCSNICEAWDQLNDTKENLDEQISSLDDAVQELAALQNEVDGLRDDLAEVGDDSDATSTVLEAAVAELDALAVLLDNTCERLATACEQANATEDALDETIDQLGATQDNLDSVEGDTESLSTTALLLGVLAIVALILSAVLAVLYFGMRKRIGGGRAE